VIFGDFFNDCVFVLSNLNYLIEREFMVYAPVAQLDRATVFLYPVSDFKTDLLISHGPKH